MLPAPAAPTKGHASHATHHMSQSSSSGMKMARWPAWRRQRPRQQEDLVVRIPNDGARSTRPAGFLASPHPPCWFAPRPQIALTQSFLRNRCRFPLPVSHKFPPPKRVRFPVKSAIFQRNGSSFRRKFQNSAENRQVSFLKTGQVSKKSC